ncbi:MAG: serine/threonine protein kinase [Lentisphaeria bacterium]|nr:serine/threonine protein kinase [Lentisphaeria bacterium]
MTPFDDVAMSMETDSFVSLKNAKEVVEEMQEHDDGPRFACSLESLEKKPQDRYKLIRSIGVGGMKYVLLVYDRDTGREIAMALMPDFRERSPQLLEQFIREARITAYLEHPNIVAVHDIGLDSNDAPFYTMSYLRGLPLTTVLKRIRDGREFETHYYSLDRRLRIFQRICNAVNYAHSKNICHLDIKPDNVNVGEYGEVRLFDWGLACETDDEGNAIFAREGKLQGTPSFMAPEQISVNPDAPKVGKRSDIFALGALLYSMLTLSLPFSGRNSEEALLKTLSEEPPRMRKVAPPDMEIPIELEAVCRKAMAKNPADRYGSISELRQAVMNVQKRYFLANINAGRKRSKISIIIMLLFIILIAILLYLGILF